MIEICVKLVVRINLDYLDPYTMVVKDQSMMMTLDKSKVLEYLGRSTIVVSVLAIQALVMGGVDLFAFFGGYGKLVPPSPLLRTWIRSPCLFVSCRG